MPKGIGSLSGFIGSLIRKDILSKGNSEYKIFFRGHSNKEWAWSPSIFRNKNYIENEYNVFNEIHSMYISEFREDGSTFEKLVRMQHFGIPTRLLDITTNPLVALYFAAQNSKTDGQVLIFHVPSPSIKYSDSDSVSCVSNLARLNKDLKKLIEAENDVLKFNQKPSTIELHHKILEEKPHFKPEIRYQDINKVYCVMPHMNNPRILAQSGAFLLFGGILSEAENWGDITYDVIDISKSSKNLILTELEKINVNQGALFPDIEKMAEYISKKYK